MRNLGFSGVLALLALSFAGSANAVLINNGLAPPLYNVLDSSFPTEGLTSR